MVTPNHDHCTINWNRYLQDLIDKSAFKEVQENYVPIGIQAANLGIKDSKADLPEIVKDHSKLVLLGEPGSGKTWAVRHLVIGQANLRLSNNPTARIPLYIELRDWNLLHEKRSKRSAKELRAEVLSFLWKSLQRSQSDAAEPPVDEPHLLLENELRNHSFMFVFDGLDEIRDPAERKLFALALTKFSYHFSKGGHIYVVASRKYGFDTEISATLTTKDFEIVEMNKRPSDDVKLALLGQYLPTKIDSSQLMDKLRVNYRLARLSDNALLLNILAEHYKPGEEPPQTRGRLLQKRTDEYITRCNELQKESAKEFLSRLAEEMRNKRRRDLEELQIVPKLQSFLKEFPQKQNMHYTEFLDLLLETRLLKRRSAPVDEISFELPQYEDYFLARNAYLELKEALGTNPQKALSLKYVRNTEWHHVLILASGLLEENQVEALAGALDDQEFLLLKARILGEAVAPQGEERFIQRLQLRLRKSFDGALTDFSRLTLSVLVLWWVGLLPLVSLVDRLWPKHHWLGIASWVLYLVGLPLLFRFAHPRLFEYQVNKIINFTMPRTLSALVCLRTGVVEKELTALRQKLKQKIPWGATNEDYLVRFITTVTMEIEQAIDLANQDPDTILSQIEENPKIVHHWLNTASEAFSPNDVEILARVLRIDDARWLKIQSRCINKLLRVGLANPVLKDQVLEALRSIASDHMAEPELVKWSREAIDTLNKPIREPVVITVQTKVAVFALFFIASLMGLSLLTKIYGDGENFWQKINNFWQFYAIWFALIALLAKFLLPARFLESLRRPKETDQTGA